MGRYRSALAPPCARRSEEASSTSASSRSLLSPQPTARSVLLRPVPHSLTVEKGMEGCLHYPFPLIPFHRDGGNSLLPPREGAGVAKPLGCLRERFPTPCPRCLAQHPQFMSPPRGEAHAAGGGREGAGARGPARSPTPTRRSWRRRGGRYTPRC